MSTELKIIGTSHIAAESIQAVKNTIKALKPDIVCLELDPRRAHALLHNHKARLSLKLAKSIGIKGFLFLAIASFLQKRIGKIVGVEPGAEMKTALHAAIENSTHKAEKKLPLIIQSACRREKRTHGRKARNNNQSKP